jgi:hypothetical protein
LKTIYIGIDNGVSGSIGIASEALNEYIKVPVKKEQDYTKTKQNVSRIDAPELIEYLKGVKKRTKGYRLFAVLERPMVNPTRFKATKSALRCLEAELIILEALKIPYSFIDSKEWQKKLLPKGCKKEELKIKSKQIGIRLFPELKKEIEKQKDADGLLISEYCRKVGY